MSAAEVATVLPRSMLYVPGDQPHLFAKAAAGPADALVLDLEDAVPAGAKDTARAEVAALLRTREERPEHPPRGPATWVRVDPATVETDLDAVLHPGLDGILLATCTLAALDRVHATIDRLWARGVADVPVVGLLESAAGMLGLAAMSRHPRLTTFGIGEVDLLADLRMARTAGTSGVVDRLRSEVVLHCAAAGLPAPVAPTSTDFRDLEAFRASTVHLRDLGFRSRTAVHPAQVPVVHDVLTPDEESVREAEELVSLFDRAGSGVAVDGRGRLVDAAVVRAARETLARRSLR